jgi:hypothetical protein
MRITDSVSWDQDVLPAWRRAAGNAESPNSDVWGKLPEGVSWFCGNIENSDIQNLYVIGSDDWKKVFGSFSLVEIAADTSPEDDKYKHRQKLRKLRDKISKGEQFEPMIGVSSSENGPFVIIDGNHRAVAYLRLGLLEDQPSFIGLHSNIQTEFVWYKLALQT